MCADMFLQTLYSTVRERRHQGPRYMLTEMRKVLHMPPPDCEITAVYPRFATLYGILFVCPRTAVGLCAIYLAEQHGNCGAVVPRFHNHKDDILWTPIRAQKYETCI